MIPITDIGTLQSASAVKAIAENVPLELARQGIAQHINTAVNTGAMTSRWVGNMQPEIKTELESLGYIVTPASMSTLGPDANSVWVISWK